MLLSYHEIDVLQFWLKLLLKQQQLKQYKRYVTGKRSFHKLDA